MSYILYSSIARAGGIDLLLNMESFAYEPTHRLRRRRPADRLARLRRRSGLLTALGRRWAPPASRPSLQPVR